MSKTPDHDNRSSLHVAARRVLLDGLEALRGQVDAVTVVGAQAIYLRSAEVELAVASFTSDADLGIDPARLEVLLEDARTAEVTSQGLEFLRTLFGGPRTPGTEMAVEALAGDPIQDQIRLITPSYVRALPESTGRRPD